jgi:positive regulator of sigma E activity
MAEQGRVVRVRGGRAEVEVESRGECEHCSAHGICNWTGNRLRRVLAVNEAGASEGDHVLLVPREGAGVGSNLLVFGVPALGMLAGVLIGGLLLSNLWAAILSGGGLVLGSVIVKVVDVAVGRSGRTLPVILRRLSEDEVKGATCESADVTGGAHGAGGR